MIKTCTLGEKKYYVNFIKGRTLREIDEPMKVYEKLAKLQKYEGDETKEIKEISIGNELDILVKWFCVLFENQFTPDEVFDNYPSDELLRDMIFAVLCVKNGTTNLLGDFPMRAAQMKKEI